ncbi:MAG TPA: hypothetical protein VLE02_01835 [Nitrosarchaeum sp.]|nr:hypothetical protein [Nitrosarchaeum sp.]
MNLQKIALITAGVIVVIVCSVFLLRKYEGFHKNKYFFPGNRYYQYFPSSTKLERQYYTCVIDNNCLNPNITDDAKVRCFEACRIKTFKGGVPDRVDLVCQDGNAGYQNKYACMERVYSDYRYA